MAALDLEAEYNNIARVPDYPAIVARWSAAAQAYAATAPVERGVRYGETPRQACDIYHPQGGAGPETPLIVYIHGGYWQRGEREIYGFIGKAFTDAGLSVAIPSYDLCPAVRVGEITRQIRACLAMLWRHTGKRPVVTGHSAGGHLTAAMLATDWSRIDGVPVDLVPAGLALSGVFELAPLIPTSLNGALRLKPEEAARESVLDVPLPRSDVMLVAAVGGAESGEFLRQSRECATLWGKKGARTQVIVVPGANHFTILDALVDPGSAVFRALVTLSDAGDR